MKHVIDARKYLFTTRYKCTIFNESINKNIELKNQRNLYKSIFTVLAHGCRIIFIAFKLFIISLCASSDMDENAGFMKVYAKLLIFH